MEAKSKFKNTGSGVAGAIQLDHQNQAKGVAVYPGESVWLSEQEQVLTAQAPRHEEDNPFTNGTFTLEVKAEDVTTSRPIGDHQADPAEKAMLDAERAAKEAAAAEEEADITDESKSMSAPAPETGAGEMPAGDPPEGVRAEHEEMAATPPAPPAPKAPPPKPLAPTSE
jgi:hypothetical protein